MINVWKKTQPRAHRKLIWDLRAMMAFDWCGVPTAKILHFDFVTYSSIGKVGIFFFLRRSQARVRLRFREDEDEDEKVRSGSRMERVLNHSFTEKSNFYTFFCVWFRPAKHCDRFPLALGRYAAVFGSMESLWVCFAFSSPQHYLLSFCECCYCCDFESQLSHHAYEWRAAHVNVSECVRAFVIDWDDLWRKISPFIGNKYENEQKRKRKRRKLCTFGDSAVPRPRSLRAANSRIRM